jgi:hypothetical protein
MSHCAWADEHLSLKRAASCSYPAGMKHIAPRRLHRFDAKSDKTAWALLSTTEPTIIATKPRCNGSSRVFVAIYNADAALEC